jgi:hypothetical protein
MANDLLPGGTADAVAAVLFMQASMNTLDAYSTLQSSPWTAENFGADEQKAASCREYLMHALAYSSLFTLGAAFIARSWWPVIAAVVTNIYLLWLYNRAIGRAQVNGSKGWEN